MWAAPESNGQLISTRRQEQELQIVSEDCSTKKVTILLLLNDTPWILLFFLKEAKFVAKKVNFVAMYSEAWTRQGCDERDLQNPRINSVSATKLELLLCFFGLGLLCISCNYMNLYWYFGCLFAEACQISRQANGVNPDGISSSSEFSGDGDLGGLFHHLSVAEGLFSQEESIYCYWN